VSDRWQIEFYREADGTEPVKEFLKDPSLRPGELKQFQTRPSLLAEKGLVLMIQRSDVLDKIETENNLYELRIDNTPNNPRFFLCAVTGKRLILLHAFKKKGRKTPPREIAIAVQRRDSVIEMEEKEDKQ
jgi:phage-related protein